MKKPKYEIRPSVYIGPPKYAEGMTEDLVRHGRSTIVFHSDGSVIHVPEKDLRRKP